ncbi:hypothetical protein LJX78_05660 [Methanimicrococcus blatticola]|uniref:hypothetical protein n=1 Tax=Methanimicrococcus blatticola TaxID=91560 RepID=UPI001E2D851F|nr:hypothetical protein [Methanimicrococcus blatticola]MCC2509088.1 hypothetical protein [Methanimicrococcus blatticola]
MPRCVCFCRVASAFAALRLLLPRCVCFCRVASAFAALRLLLSRCVYFAALHLLFFIVSVRLRERGCCYLAVCICNRLPPTPPARARPAI